MTRGLRDLTFDTSMCRWLAPGCASAPSSLVVGKHSRPGMEVGWGARRRGLRPVPSRTVKQFLTYVNGRVSTRDRHCAGVMTPTTGLRKRLSASAICARRCELRDSCVLPEGTFSSDTSRRSARRNVWRLPRLPERVGSRDPERGVIRESDPRRLRRFAFATRRGPRRRPRESRN